MDKSITWWLETVVILTGAASGLIGFFSLLAMFFYSILRIERHMKRDGLPRPCAWDIWIYRIFFYWPELSKSHARLVEAAKGPRAHIDIDLTQIIPYIRPIDRFIARTAIICAVLFFVFGAALMLYQRSA